MAKKILIVGVLDVPTSTNVFMKKGFEKLGYSVDSYNYRTISKKLGEIELMWEDFGRFIHGRKYDLIVFCKVNGMHPVLLDKAKEAGPTWYWFMDNAEMAKKICAVTFAQNATFASSTASNVWERFAMINKNSYHIIEGYDPEIYYYEDLKKIHDFLFIGNATPDRVRELRRLQIMAPHRKFTIFGEGWPSGDEFNVNVPVFGEDERTEINQARFVLNLVHDECIFSDRVTKALGCGATVISQYSKDLHNLFGGITYPYTSFAEFEVMAKSNFPLMTPEESKLLAVNISVLFSWETICKTILGRVNEYQNG